MASGWNLWMWLECIGVVSVDILTIIITFPDTPLLLALFGQQHPYFFVHFKNVFSFLLMLFLCNIARCSKNIRDRSKIEIARI